MNSERKQTAQALLIVRCQLGEQAAFEQLIKDWSGPLFGFVVRVTGDAQVSQDLVQDIWIRVLRGIGRLKEIDKFRSWLFGIAHRVLMDRFRALGKSPSLEFQGAEQVEDATSFTDDQETREWIEFGLSGLALPEREVLVLFYLEQFTLSDIAAVLGIPSGTVKSRLFRAKKNLHQRLIKGEQYS